ncbi:uncharacterized protein J4E87_000627 [Alternaria ethzedia]|uniref:uncharacterized protein n=1 Tax=Alternaria ethzedia TaxID=181014 RepID=UPI0020C32354|nr:uncharacterized protein J4E87_000627 [Alternaria ethzedia]KAI4635672.1 hypothetical protein J4E87_000627 [Alternaria ethzedia]
MSQDQSPPGRHDSLSATARARHRQRIRLSMFPSFSELDTSVPHPSAVAPDVAQAPIDRHSLRSRRYYGTQELRPNVPVNPQPTAEDIARRSRKSGVRFGTHDTPIRDASGRRQSKIWDMEDITSGLNTALTSRSNGVGQVRRPQKLLQGIDKFGQVFTYSQCDDQAMNANETQNGTTDESKLPDASPTKPRTWHDEEQGLGESFEMVQYEDELTEDFEEVDRDIPTDFNGKVPR